MTDIHKLAAQLKEGRKNMLREMLDDGRLTQADVLSVLHEVEAPRLQGVTADKAREAAFDICQYGTQQNIQVDSNPLFSQGDEGVWVSAWVHVSNVELGIPKPMPDELQGRVWLVGECVGPDLMLVSGIVGGVKARINIDGTLYGAEPVDDMVAAVNSFDERSGHDNEWHVQADSAEEALQIVADAKSHKIIVDSMWIQDKDDDRYGFSLQVPRPIVVEGAA